MIIFKTHSTFLRRLVAGATVTVATVPAWTGALATQRPLSEIFGHPGNRDTPKRVVTRPVVGSESAAGGLARHKDALGERMRVPGRERTTLTGQVTDRYGRQAAARVTLQTPGLVSLRGFNAGAELKFDGNPVVLPMSREDAALVETFTADLPEGLFAAVQAGGALRLLGVDFAPESETADHKEPHYDIYTLTYPVNTSPDRPVRIKRFFFDTETGLLARTTYIVDETPVETRFSDWRRIDGSMYPSQVERYENGERVFVFNITGVTAGAAADPALFRP
ncbi:MAG TPA: hypothetical protein VFY29_17000 [Terriglobia bacterium]|nr:hypothetical protein [Terriglobia bacterium]